MREGGGPKLKLLRGDIRKRLIDGIRSGATHELACKYAGVSLRQFYTWCAKGRDGEEPYAAFLEELHNAEGAGSVQCLALIRKAATEGHWQAAAWLLERRYPSMYGRTVVEVQDGGAAPENDRERRTARIDELLAKGRGTSDAKPIDN